LLQSEARTTSRSHSAWVKAAHAHATTTRRDATASSSHSTHPHATHTTPEAHLTAHPHARHARPHSHSTGAAHVAHATHAAHPAHPAAHSAAALPAHGTRFRETAALGLHFPNADALGIGEHAERRRPCGGVVARDLLS
jgi:hypothetical protein